MKYIVTHPGGTHRDDLLAVSLGLAFNPGVDVFRRDPTPEEIQDPQVLVLDVGGLHSAACNSFDHHQLPREHEATCAFKMYAEAYGIWNQLSELYPWAVNVPVLDSKGPTALANKYGYKDFSGIVGLYDNPIEGLLLDEMKATSRIVSGTCLHIALSRVGNTILAGLNAFKTRMSELTAQAKVEEIEFVEVLLLPDLPDPTQHSHIFKNHWEIANDAGGVIRMSICKDDRGPGWAIYRFNDDPMIDMQLIKDEPGVTFVHAGGFIAKTAAMSLDQAKILAGKCVKKHDPNA
jgi:hypothetical protein